jgi:hypothetical protein
MMRMTRQRGLSGLGCKLRLRLKLPSRYGRALVRLVVEARGIMW